MNKLHTTLLSAAAGLALAACSSTSDETLTLHREVESVVSSAPRGAAPGWHSWRGPRQDGTSPETGLFDTAEVGGQNHLWSFDRRGRGTPVVAGERVYAYCYDGEGPDLQESLVCLDAGTGELLWEHRWNDFITEVIYDRYALGAPTIDPATGNVFIGGSAGEIFSFTPDGELRWTVSLMEEFGRLSFPNGRTGAVLIDGQRAIVHLINSNVGPEGPARDRFYAFDKDTGECLWGSTPGIRPYDSSFSFPVVEWRGGRRVLYADTGCGNVVAIDANVGKPLWRFLLAGGGLSSNPVIYKDTLIAVNGKENIDTSVIGRMVALKLGAEPGPGEEGPVVLGPEAEVWRADLVSFTSSPTLVGNRIYQTVATGELHCVDADTGADLWSVKLASDQIHASPVYADGKLYVPMNDGSFHVLRPSDEGAEELCKLQLEGNCLGAPAVAGGRVYVHTTEKLYCFGEVSEPVVTDLREEAPPAGPAVALRVTPAYALLRRGQSVDVRIEAVDAKGRVVGVANWGGFKSPANLDLEHVLHLQSSEGESGIEGSSELTMSVPADGRYGFGVARVESAEGLAGVMRLRVVPDGAFSEDFEGIELSEDHKVETGVKFAYPPGHWLGGRAKWEVREREGNKVLAKTLDVPILQRAQGTIGAPEMRNYTLQADFLTDGNRRTLSTGGLINQRYLIKLRGNHQQLEVSSNEDRVKESVPFKWKAGVWYTLETRVDVAEDGSGVVRARAWPRDEAKPEAWTIEVRHKHAHTHGAPGYYGFSPQSRFRIYMDNLVVTPNEDELSSALRSPGNVK